MNLTDEPYSNRRSVYGYIDRGGVPELMAQFDFADPDMANSRRASTIVPQQALFFMNSPMEWTWRGRRPAGGSSWTRRTTRTG